MPLTRRRLLAASALAALPARAAVPRFEASDALTDAARKEGGFVDYTAQIEDVEQDIIAAFNQRFPFVKVEVVHAPGGQLIERIRAEVATGKLTADLIDHSEPGLLATMNDIFRPYRPPNADGYIAGSNATDRLWPRLTAGWCLAWNTELIGEKPLGWWDLTKPAYAGSLGVPSGFTGGSTWARAMFERKVLGEDYWPRQAALRPRIYPSIAATADALVRGEVTVAPVSYPGIALKLADGAPIGFAYPTEGVPCFLFAAGITLGARRPAAARLYLDWCLSAEGQAAMIRGTGHLTALKVPPLSPAGLGEAKPWFADRAESDRLRAPWLQDWARAYGVRQ
jgi:iron(III) transport system substrate-binding protein